jgi:DNA-directed RNA polymerase specialized sigma24 family protein
MIDINHIQARHDEIHAKLENWARWVRPKPSPWNMQPMFRMYQSKARHWEAAPHIRIEINTLQASELERAVAILPSKNRTLVRWFYVCPWVPVGAVRQELGLTRDTIGSMLDDARDMLKNRLAQKMVEK